MGLEVARGSALGEVQGDIGLGETAGGGELALAEGLNLGDDGERDGLGAVSSEVETYRGVDAVAGSVDGLAGKGGGFRDEQGGAVAGTEDADVGGRSGGGEECAEQVAVLFVAMGHKDDRIGWGEVESGHCACRGKGLDAVSFGEAHGAGELSASVGDQDGPTEEGGDTGDGAGIVSGAEEDEALGRVETLLVDL